MKKQLLALTTALLITFSATFANGTQTVPENIVAELHRDFTNASNVQWKTTENYYKASFTVDGQQLEAFYSPEGEMIGLSRPIDVAQLPLTLIKEVKDMTAKYTVSELFELVTNRGTEYFITYKNDQETKIYRGADGSWSRY